MSTLAQKNFEIFHLSAFPNLEILLANPPPLLQISVDFVLRQEVQNRFFIFSISLLNSILNGHQYD